jgi:hypothetical protein
VHSSLLARTMRAFPTDVRQTLSSTINTPSLPNWITVASDMTDAAENRPNVGPLLQFA